MQRPAVLALTVLSGFTGLAYEVTWQKYLGILLGAHSEATAAVLGLFLGGLSLGYWLFGALTRRLVARGRAAGRPAPLLRVYGGVEAAIGAYCLLFPWLFPIVRVASAWLPTGAGALGFAVDVALAALLILPPATLMGGTIPILTQALARNLDDATRVHAQIYAANTAGAFAGTLATGFVLVHQLGLTGTLYAMGVANLAIGAAFVWLGRRSHELADLERGEAPALGVQTFAVYGSVALLVGFAMMVLQTTVIRIGGLSFGSAEYTFTIVVAVFVLCIALGSSAVSVFPRIGRAVLPVALWSLALLFTALYFGLETGPYWAHRLRVVFRDFDAAFYPFYLGVFGVTLLAIGPAVVFSGAVLPLLFHALRREVGDLGAQAGRLYSVNTVGSLVGALIGGYALLFWLDLHHVYRIALCALALAAAVITLHEFPRIRFAGAAVLLLTSLVAVNALPAWRPRYLVAGTFRNRQPEEWTFQGPSVLGQRYEGSDYVFYDDDPNSSIGVLESQTGQVVSRSLIVNGKSDGNTIGDYPTTALLALLPSLFAERVENAFVIGFGTGISAGELTQLAETQTVTVAEISSGVIEASPLFDFANHAVSKSPKLRIIHSDAYRALVKSPQRYDVIVSEPSNPWVTGVEMLYSKEFLSEARDHLTPHGVFSQWFHYYESTDEAVGLVLRTYAEVFDRVAVWTVNHADVVLLGFRDADTALDLDRLAARVQRPDFSAALARLSVPDLPTLLVHETLPLGVTHAAALSGPIHSLYHPLLSFEAGRGFFAGTRGRLPFTGYGQAAEIGAANSLLGRYLARMDGDVPEALREELAWRACSEETPGCSVLAAVWSRTEPHSARFPQLVATLRNNYGPLFLRRLRRLLDSAKPRPPTPQNRIRPAVALEWTQVYMDNYTHALPFDPAGLLEAWQRCGLNQRQAQLCARGLRETEKLVLGDQPRPADEWLDSTGEIASETLHAAPPGKAEAEAEEEIEP